MPHPHGTSAALRSPSARIMHGIIAPISTPLGATSTTDTAIRAVIGSAIRALSRYGKPNPATHDSAASATPHTSITVPSFATGTRADAYEPAAVLSSSENRITTSEYTGGPENSVKRCARR